MIRYFRDDKLGLVMENNGRDFCYAPKKGEFEPLKEIRHTEDGSLISAAEAKRVRENYDRHYAHLREK